jgi:hypothetical protein
MEYVQPYHGSLPVNPKNLNTRPNYNSLAYTLLSMEPRIRLCDWIQHLKVGKEDLSDLPQYKDIVGYLPTKDYLYFTVVIRIEHQIAHLLEMNNLDRCVQMDYGFENFSKIIYSHTPPKPKPLFAALSREIRVGSIQSYFKSNPQLHQENQEVLLNDFWKNFVKSSLPFGRFNSLQDVIEWGEHLKSQTYKAWSVDRIHHEWSIKLNHLRNWMETQ